MASQKNFRGPQSTIVRDVAELLGMHFGVTPHLLTEQVARAGKSDRVIHYVERYEGGKVVRGYLVLVPVVSEGAVALTVAVSRRGTVPSLVDSHNFLLMSARRYGLQSVKLMFSGFGNPRLVDTHGLVSSAIRLDEGDFISIAPGASYMDNGVTKRLFLNDMALELIKHLGPTYGSEPVSISAVCFGQTGDVPARKAPRARDFPVSIRFGDSGYKPLFKNGKKINASAGLDLNKVKEIMQSVGVYVDRAHSLDFIFAEEWSVMEADQKDVYTLVDPAEIRDFIVEAGRNDVMITLELVQEVSTPIVEVDDSVPTAMPALLNQHKRGPKTKSVNKLTTNDTLTEVLG